MNKKIETIEELKNYTKENNLNALFYGRQIQTPSVESLEVLLFGGYLEEQNIIERMYLGTFLKDMFVKNNSDKAAVLEGAGILVMYKEGGERVKSYTFRYKFGDSERNYKKEMEKLTIEEIEICTGRKEEKERILKKLKPKMGQPLYEFWENLQDELIRALGLGIKVQRIDVSEVLKGMRASEYYREVYPGFVRRLGAVLIENFEGAENLEELFGGKYIPLAISPKEIINFSNNRVKYSAQIIIDESCKEKVKECAEKVVKSKELENEKNIGNLQRKLFQEFNFCLARKV